jgi:hypothetical protein
MAVAAARHVSFGERQHAVVVKFVRNGGMADGFSNRRRHE